MHLPLLKTIGLIFLLIVSLTLTGQASEKSAF